MRSLRRKENSIIDYAMFNSISNFYNKESVDTKDKYNRLGIERSIKYKTSIILPITDIVPDFNELEAITKDPNSVILGNMNVTTIEDVTYEEAINIINDIYQDDNFYGVLLKINDEYINILHPIIANYLINTTGVISFKEYKTKMVIYTIKNKDIISDEPTKEMIKYWENEILKTLLLNIHKDDAIMVISQFEKTHDRILKDFMWNNKVVLRQSQKMSFYNHKDEIMDMVQFIIPHQFLSKNVIYPYYGYSLVNADYTRHLASAIDISPMLSPNISKHEENRGNGSQRGICFGDNKYMSINAFKAMNYANLGSPLRNKILKRGWVTFYKTSIKISMQLFRDAYGIAEKENITPEEIKPYEEYDGISREEYLTILAQRK